MKKAKVENVVKWNLPKKKFSILYVDPPWSYNKKVGKGIADDHYNTLSISQLKKMPIYKITKDNCWLFMWVTYPMLQEALDLGKSWGFVYKTCAFLWVKLYKNKRTPFHGLGHYTRANTELCLLFTRGNVKRKNTSVSQVVMSSMSKHSQKPNIIRKRIIKLCGKKSRIELFARKKYKGWVAWGNEV